MKYDKFVIWISVCFVIFFFGMSVYLYEALQAVLFNTGYRSLGYTLMALSIFFLTMSTVTIVYIIQKPKEIEKKNISSISNLVFTSDVGEIKKELDISEKQSVLMGKGEMADIDLSYLVEEHSIATEHAILNFVGHYWYIEAVTENYKVGLRREYDDTTYKLKYFTPYKLTVNDIIYISDIKIIVK